MKNSMPETRLKSIDILRGYGIVLIVLGHCIAGLLLSKLLGPNPVWARYFLIFLYLFHMPVIFFVSGFVARDHKKQAFDFLSTLLKWIVAPYVIWTALLVFIQNITPSAANNAINPSELLSIFWRPISIFWFLYALFVLKIINYSAIRLFQNRLAVSIMLAIIGAGFFGIWEYAGLAMGLLPKIMACLFFYSLGRIAAEKPELFEASLKSIEADARRSALVIAICAVGVAVAAWLYANAPAESINALSEPQGWFVVTGSVGILALLLISRKTAALWFAAWIQQIGLYSMVIYVQHTIWGAGVRVALTKFNLSNPLLLIAAIVVAGILLSMLWQNIADKFGLTKYFGIRPIKF